MRVRVPPAVLRSLFEIRMTGRERRSNLRQTFKAGKIFYQSEKFSVLVHELIKLDWIGLDLERRESQSHFLVQRKRRDMQVQLSFEQ